MKALVLLALSKAVLSALASQVTPDKETKTQSVSSTELEALNNLSVDVQSGAFVVEPGEIFEVTARVNGDFSRAPLERSLWLGLRFLPVGDADAQEQSARASELLWEKLEGSTASWSLKLNGKGEYRALVLGQFYCNVEEKSFKEADYLPCLQPLPLRQGTELQIRVSHVSARLKLSWDKPQTIRALSRLKDAPQGELQVSAISLDGSELRRDFKGTVYLVAIGTNEESNFSSQPALGGQTSARLINGVATFSNLQLVREGTFRLVATADGAQATESATVIVAPAVSRVIRRAIRTRAQHRIIIRALFSFYVHTL
ncbi:hypothetical protein, conserved [Eimeria tenella]|uniref:Uncharacterized protein n=1 Tax=Eimeria tenella TaxID=5802 RepID=U6KXI2_EIMTE|nr:hypothetical protein, conserved [Eimeria tenella]CDJ42867.1 hypothetical protein, conserved [Eimeria tenella]|eukprot:XP_013233617.1 hypothetical protein, conserved [Eimeria tenella]